MKIEPLIYSFRKAIEFAKANNEPGEFFINFPTGQCGHASDILAQYLIDNGISPIMYVCGTYYGDDWDDRYSHAWLVVEEAIIDITGDQFQHHKKPLSFDLPVYIGPMSDFHQLFEVDPGGMCEHHGLEHQWTNYHK